MSDMMESFVSEIVNYDMRDALKRIEAGSSSYAEGTAFRLSWYYEQIQDAENSLTRHGYWLH